MEHLTKTELKNEKSSKIKTKKSFLFRYPKYEKIDFLSRTNDKFD